MARRRCCVIPANKRSVELRSSYYFQPTGPGRYAIAEWRECLGPSGTGHRHALRRPYRVGLGRRDASRLLTVTAVTTTHSFRVCHLRQHDN